MTRLTFPEPAAELLARSHEILDRHLTPHTPGESGWAIGGGSALAARWKHRWSKHLDIIVGTGTEFARLTEAVNPGLWREMRAAGATTIESEGTLRFEFGERQIEIEVAPPVVVARYGSQKLERQAVYRTSAEAREGFEADGLNAALKARGWNPRRILKEATAALEHGQALTITPMGQHPEKTPESP